MLHGVASFVWQDLPGQLEPNVSAWLVKAANGNSTTGGGHDYALSYAAWADRVGPARTHAWTWLYHTTNGARAAEVLVAAAPKAAGYGIDVEGDDPGVAAALDLEQLVPVVRAFYARIRELRPGVDVWFTSYPDRWQATSHGAPWQELVAGCDYGIPQVYYASQGDRWQQIVADHQGKPIVAAFSPGDWTTGWHDLASTAMRRFGAVALWRYPYTRPLGNAIASLTALTPTPEDDMPLSDTDKQWLKDNLMPRTMDDPSTSEPGHWVPVTEVIHRIALDTQQAIPAAIAKVAQTAGVTLPADFAQQVVAELGKDITAGAQAQA